MSPNSVQPVHFVILVVVIMHLSDTLVHCNTDDCVSTLQLFICCADLKLCRYMFTLNCTLSLTQAYETFTILVLSLYGNKRVYINACIYIHTYIHTYLQEYRIHTWYMMTQFQHFSQNFHLTTACACPDVCGDAVPTGSIDVSIEIYGPIGISLMCL